MKPSFNAERTGVEALAIDMDNASVGSSQHKDDEIVHSIESALKWHTYATNDAVEIAVQGGHVTLGGALEFDWQRHGVVSTVRLLPGVVDVRDQIVIKSKGSQNAVKSDVDV